MATVQTIEDGPRNLVIKVDGTGAESDAKIVDVSALTPPCTSVRLLRITYSLAETAAMQLLWDAATDVVLLNLHGGNDADMCFESTAGIPNNAGAGVTGDVLLDGGAASTPYTLYIEFLKNGVEIT